MSQVKNDEMVMVIMVAMIVMVIIDYQNILTLKISPSKCVVLDVTEMKLSLSFLYLSVDIRYERQGGGVVYVLGGTCLTDACGGSSGKDTPLVRHRHALLPSGPSGAQPVQCEHYPLTIMKIPPKMTPQFTRVCPMTGAC